MPGRVLLNIRLSFIRGYMQVSAPYAAKAFPAHLTQSYCWTPIRLGLVDAKPILFDSVTCISFRR